MNLRRLTTYSRKILILAAALLLAAGQFALPKGVYAEEKAASAAWPQEPEIQSASAVLMDLDSGEILYGKEDQTARYPASTTKLMTALLALEHSKLDETVTFSSDAVFKNETNSSHIARDVGEQMSMEQTLYGVLLASANECAYAIAEHVGANMGGDYNTFIQAMNDRAKELGCVNTHFVNSSGLHDDQHYTCAYDLALIAREAYQNETLRKMVGTRRYEIPPTNKHADPTPLNNTHAMLSANKTSKFLYDGCQGGKTGYTDEARHSLVTYVERDGRKLVCVSMCAEGNDSYKDTIALMDWGLANFHKVSLEDETLQSKVDEAIKASGRQGLSWQAKGTLLLPKDAAVRDLAVKLEPKKNGQGTDSANAGSGQAGADAGNAGNQSSGQAGTGAGNAGNQSSGQAGTGAGNSDKGGEEVYQLTLSLGGRSLLSQSLKAQNTPDQKDKASGASGIGRAIGNFFGGLSDGIGKGFRTVIAPILLAVLLILVLLALALLILNRRRRARRRARKNRVHRYRGRR